MVSFLQSQADAVAKNAQANRLGHDFRWPGGRTIAVVFNIAYEAWSDGKAPGIGPMGNPLPPGTFDTNALSWGNYGAQLGIKRLLASLARSKTHASVMVSGILAERYPKNVRAIAEAGHEIVAHSWAQDVIPAALAPEQVRADIEKTTEALAKAAGLRPRGWISPRGTPNPDSARLLLEAKYAWHGDAFDDDRPYVQNFGSGKLVAIPLTMELNDLPHAMRFGRSPRQFVELYDDFIAHAAQSDETIMIDVTAHTHCYGRPSGAWAFEEIALKAKAESNVWIATRSEIADHVLSIAG